MSSEKNRADSSGRTILWSVRVTMILLCLGWLVFCNKDFGLSGVILISTTICVFVLLRMVFEWFGFIGTGDEWQDWRSEPFRASAQASEPSGSRSEQIEPSRKAPGKSRLAQQYRKTLKERFRWASDRHYNRND